MAIYSYVITRDYGFAPNPFYSMCTLATCKSLIRGSAQIGDWILGFGSSNTDYKNKLIYAMQVQTKITFDEYWNGEEYQCKKPVMNGSLKQVYGDNIYHHDSDGIKWIQDNSHHSNKDGSINPINLETDTRHDAVLISRRYWYFGEKAITVPEDLSELICNGRGYRKFTDEVLKLKLEKWIDSLSEKGLIGDPIKFDGGFYRYGGQ
ncbi:MAG: hypothetical protein K2M17_00965 [Bacilli bacterium]|nr:hypothetical protein [Bacilli bacterium]